MSSAGSVRGTLAPSYFCRDCNRSVTPIPATQLSCPLCHGGLLEDTTIPVPNPNPHAQLFDFIFRFLQDLDLSNLNPERSHDPLLQFVRDHINGSIAGSGSVEISVLIDGVRIGNEPGTHRALPAAQSAVDALPEIVVSESLVSVGGHEAWCSVCRDEVRAGAIATQMPCGHVYHRDCILPWLALRNSCPVCRRELPATGAVGDGNVGQQIAELDGVIG
ncbi:hypothetical protein J5N97_023980 [Dioscorea zingiberensis]|uniref:RING-type E3 ubiquitin transferase n=1 Tax=Dioscorea zingiberensis TaxID=325984 RepID=A0A9D5C6F5_9LILI|nr:hypothetical protein J5N97_023980 [Dioscorea zingiberensis]